MKLYKKLNHYLLKIQRLLLELKSLIKISRIKVGLMLSAKMHVTYITIQGNCIINIKPSTIKIN